MTPFDVMESVTGQLPNDVVAGPRGSRDSWLVDARIELHDLERALGAGGLATKHPFMTLAGLVLENLKRIPLIGEAMVVNGWRLEVMEIDNNRIERLLVSRLPDTSRLRRTLVRSVAAHPGEAAANRREGAPGES